MTDDTLTPTHVAELLQRQERLQHEADALLADFDLVALLRHAGEPWRVGSSVLGLMAWRDIDFNVLCESNTAERAMDAVRPLLAHPRLHRLRYSNETGRFNASGEAVDEGYYVGLHAVTDAGEGWKIDVWFLPAAVPRPEIALLRSLPPQLTDDTRRTILWLKDIWHRLPSYQHGVSGIDIYDAVLQHGVRTPALFDAYLRERGKPART